VSTPILVTKLFAPPRGAHGVSRTPLIARLNSGLSGKLTLVSAPAGFGKSSLLAEWAAGCHRPCVWVSLDQGERDVHQFLAYLVAAVQTVDPSLGADASALLQTTPPASAQAVLTALLNEVAEDLEAVLIVLDDYHLIAGAAVDEALAFLFDHLPAHMHVAVATRTEPALPLARLRARGQLTELRQDDLRLSPSEAEAFLNQAMALGLSAKHVEVLAARTEGWVAGLQMVAIALRNQPDPHEFIDSFSGKHRFLQDFLLEEVLHRQPPAVLHFLLRTSVLDRFCADLCNAVTGDRDGPEMLARLEQANLFIVPLDSERRWFRYHHLFAELLRQRLEQRESLAPLQLRASEWHEAQGQPLSALPYALAAADFERAIRLIDGGGMPLYFRHSMAPLAPMLQGIADKDLDRHARLWLMLAWTLMVAGYPTQMEAKLESGQAALRRSREASPTDDLWGQVAALKAWAAVAKNDVRSIHAEAERAIEKLDPHNHATLTAVHCAQGVAHQFEGQRAAAEQAYRRVHDTGHATGNQMFAMIAAMGLASIQLGDNRLHVAAKTYREALREQSDLPHSLACEAHLGLARIHFEWNDLDAAESHARQSSRLAQPTESGAGLSADAMVARVLQVRQRFDDAGSLLAEAAVAARTRKFSSRLAEITSLQALALVHQGRPEAALELAQRHDLPLATARALQAQGEAGLALPIVEAYRRQVEAAGRGDELLKALVTQVMVLQALGRPEEALPVLRQALLLGEPAGFIRSFIDEGQAMAGMLERLSEQGLLPEYIAQLLSAVRSAQAATRQAQAAGGATDADTLSERELDILRLIQQGRSNQEIGAALFLSLHTVKWHNQNIFDKLQVKRRTEAVARALALRLLPP
jgi:LuxR family transcriptional regulator, maltose regulon positive regulatory protein